MNPRQTKLMKCIKEYSPNKTNIVPTPEIEVPLPSVATPEFLKFEEAKPVEMKNDEAAPEI